MIDLNEHYRLLLGLSTSWEVNDVQLSLENQKVEIELFYTDEIFCCPVCGEKGSLHDYSPERSWRHLDTMQFETIIRASVPRCNCKNCGVKTISVPWATGHTRFTLMFESFVIQVLQSSSSISAACELLGINWHAANAIMKRAVDRGMERRKDNDVPYVGIDEKSFLCGQNYIVSLTDLLEGKVIDVVKDRDTKSATELFNCLTDKQKDNVEAIAMDFWKPFIASAEKTFPEALIVHDRFHIDKYINDAVDKVRRGENRQLIKEDDKTLTGSKWCWIQNPENMSEKRKKQFETLLSKELKTGQAWALKNTFREFWDQTSYKSAQLFFDSWIAAVEYLEIKPLLKVAQMLERHIKNI